MDDFKFNMVLAAMALLTVFLMVVKLTLGNNKLDKYDDTITEYMMCIEYNPDCECSDIILSEYGVEE